jgi:sodium-dependent dicarboxylate transporter 2/3/5
MAAWWFTEAIPVYATALLPLVLLPLLRATTMKAAAAPYAHELIFLFMGGFLLALAMERWGLHRRVALAALRVAGDRPINVVGAFMAVSAGLSMWVSNTATAIMMLPVALSVIGLVSQSSAPLETGEDAGPPDAAVGSFGVALLLGIAYAASIGGVATPIGTPPNLFLLSYVDAHLDREISFVRWMALAVPLVAVFLPIAWLLLTRVLHPVRLPRIEGSSALVGRALRELGPMSRGERIVLGVFLLTAGLWITRPLLGGIELAGIQPLAGLTDAGIAMLAALLLFVAPIDWRAGTFALDWDTAVKLPWGILILFGGGLSLAAAIQQNGVAELIGSQVSGFGDVPSWIVVLAVVTTILFLTELTSNTATTAALVPVLATVAPGLGFDPLLLAVPAAISASCAFMLPVATPPNAVVFGSGLVRIPEMVRAGFWLNLTGIALVTAFTYAVAMPVLGVR